MRSLAGSVFLLGMLLSTPLIAGAPRDPAPIRVGGPACTRAPTAACMLQGSCTAPAGEREKTGLAEARAPANVCRTIAAAAGANDLPTQFLTRLIWQESRFDPGAISRAGAQGVAQFMPATARWRGLADPFEPTEAITKSAQFLRDLRREFGNLGLAAAAYNAGPKRVGDWLSGRRGLPAETRTYVRLVTGRSAEEWAGAQTDPPEMPAASGVPCPQTADLLVHPSSAAEVRNVEPQEPWGVELVGSSSEAKALAAYRQLQQKYSAILGGREPRVVFHGVVRDMGWARVRVGADSRTSAQKLCADLRAAGAGCDVLRN